MDYAQQHRNSSNHLVGIAFVVLFHALLIYALVNGLARKVVEVVKGPLETKIIQEIKPPPPEAPPPPPPKLAPPPPPFIPPPEVNIAQPAAPVQNTITTVTNVPTPAQPAPVAAPSGVHKAPVIHASACRKPEFPSISQRLGEHGTVTLLMLVGVDGRVTDSKVGKSSGYPRLDEAARSALSLCKFEPGTVDGKPEAAWAPLLYRWDNPDQ